MPPPPEIWRPEMSLPDRPRNSIGSAEGVPGHLPVEDRVSSRPSLKDRVLRLIAEAIWGRSRSRPRTVGDISCALVRSRGPWFWASRRRQECPRRVQEGPGAARRCPGTPRSSSGVTRMSLRKSGKMSSKMHFASSEGPKIAQIGSLTGGLLRENFPSCQRRSRVTEIFYL